MTRLHQASVEISDGLPRLPEIGFSITQNQPKNVFEVQVKQGFSSFIAKYLPYFMILQSFTGPLALKKSSNK